jgi:PGF-pre-PGF domain-containing protein
MSKDGSRVLVGAEQVTAGSFAGASYIFVPPYATFSAGGTTRGQAGAFVDGLTLRPSLSLTTCDLYLGTTETDVSGTPVKTGIASLTAASATTINGVDLTGKNPGTYYLIACENGTTMALASTTSAAFTVTAIPTTSPTTTNDSSSADSSDDSSRGTSFVVTSPGTGAGSTMTFAVSEPLNAGGIDYPYAILTVTLVPKETLGSTDLIVTDAGSMTNVPDDRTFVGIVTISPVAVNPSEISTGTISFEVSMTWLSNHGLAPEDIVLMRFHNNEWTELPTTYLYEAGGAYYFTATTPGFSYFAIANRANTTPAKPTATITSIQVTSATAGSTQAATVTFATPASVKAASSAPVTSATTVPPAAGTNTGGSAGIPTLAILAGIGAIAIVAGGAIIVRRWRMQRQNPALFRKYN